MPVSGPTGHEIERAAHNTGAGALNRLPFNLVEVATPAAIPALAAVPQSTLFVAPPPPTDLIGPGDLLNITIYEAGVSLFGTNATRLGASAAANSSQTGGLASEPATNAARFPGVRVDDQGFVHLPFVGRLRASGHTTAELQSLIRKGLRGMSQDPQVMVALDESITNSVVLAGEVSRPGRFVLPTNRESLNDTVALAGGYKGDAKDLVARVQRGSDSFEIRVSDLMDLPQRDLRIAPGDRITLLSRPQSFSVLGAPNQAQEIRFPRSKVSLAEAVALAGGANPNAGDAGAVFVFRYVPQGDGTERPTVYHLNMMRPGVYLLSQRFQMQDRDVLYVGNARANQLTKFVQLLSQLFVPVATARAVTQ